MTIDDEKLIKLFEALDPKRRRQALKGALRRTANLVRKKAQANLKSSHINTSTGLPKGIRRLLYKQKLGFRVTVGTGKKGVRGAFHTNRQGKEKPVLLWAEGGTGQRFTKTATRIFRRKRSGHSTGSMPRYGFMEKTRQEMSPEVDALLKNEINLNIQKIAKKYGCTIS